LTSFTTTQVCLAPAGTPADVANRMNTELNRVFGALGLESRANSGAEFGAFPQVSWQGPRWRSIGSWST